MYNNKILSLALVAIILALIALFSLSIKSVEANESKSLRENIQHELANTNNTDASACPFPGNYCKSCIGCYESLGGLFCQCYDTNGVLDSGTMIKISSCPNGYIMNINSDLTCFKQAPTICKYPGNYCLSCKNCRESGPMLICTCNSYLGQRPKESSIILITCTKGYIGGFYSLACAYL